MDVSDSNLVVRKVQDPVLVEILVEQTDPVKAQVVNVPDPVEASIYVEVPDSIIFAMEVSDPKRVVEILDPGLVFVGITDPEEVSDPKPIEEIPCPKLVLVEVPEPM